MIMILVPGVSTTVSASLTPPSSRRTVWGSTLTVLQTTYKYIIDQGPRSK